MRALEDCGIDTKRPYVMYYLPVPADQPCSQMYVKVCPSEHQFTPRLVLLAGVWLTLCG